MGGSGLAAMHSFGLSDIAEEGNHFHKTRDHVTHQLLFIASILNAAVLVL